jgi:iron complex outermembrane receptor protein
MANSTLLKNLFTLLLFGLPMLVFSQVTVNGTVTDADSGEPLIGVNILVKGTSTGTVTDFDGKYEIDIPSEGSILVFSYTGYQSKDITIGKGVTYDVTLSSGEVLEEVVVIGYGSVKRKDATGSLQSVSSEDFNRGNITGPQELLSGKVAGVSITTDGAPGEGAKIRIRGETSLSASNDPLIVVDGVPLENYGVSGSRNPLNIINPNDVESITVLKDASAAAIYGNRAAGGVILIKNKKGEVGTGLRIGYNGNVSIANPTNKVPALNAEEFRQAIEDNFAEDHPARTLMGDSNTNWQDLIYQQAVSHDHNLNLSGSFGWLPYRVSVGYSNIDGILKTDEFNRMTGNLSLNPGFFDNKLQVNLNGKFMNTNNRFANRGAIWQAASFDPTQAVYDEGNDWGGYTTWLLPNGNPNSLAPPNPLASLELRDDRSSVQRYIANTTIDYRFHFLPDLRADLNVAYDYRHSEGKVEVPPYASFAWNENNPGESSTYGQEKYNSLFEYYMNYKKALGLHVFDIMGGYSWQHFKVVNLSITEDTGGTTVEANDPAEYYLLSLYGRFNYTLSDRYLFTFTVRRDGTSRFAPENRWGLFPAAALAIKVLENENAYFDNLKLRFGWGITGQQEIGDYYAYQARYEASYDNARYQFGDEFITTLRPNGYDSNIQWEETESYNIGADFSIVKDRLSGSLDFYKRFTTNLLNYVPVPAGTNLTNYVTTNIGNMENQGFEVSLNLTPIKTDLVNWEIAANLSYNESVITKLTTAAAEADEEYKGVATGGIAGGVGSSIQIHSVGYAPSSFFVYKQLYDDDGNLLEGEFEDLNGDELINDDDKYRYEKPTADYFIGISNNLSIGDFYLNFGARASIGNYVYNNVQTDAGYINRMYNPTNYLSNIHKSGIDLNVKDQANLTFSDHFVTKADFLRFDHITLGYNLQKLLGQNVNVYLTMQNALLFTPYEGMDPEIGNGIDNNIYPRSKTFVIGLNANFNTKK